MKQRFFIVVALCAFLFTSCMKEDDFSELKHPLQLQGEFDPVFGIPIAKISSDMNTFLGLLHTGDNVSISIDSETDQVAFRYHDTLSFEYIYDGAKSHSRRPAKGASKGAYGDSIVLDCRVLQGSTDIDLFEKLTEVGNGKIEAKGMYVTLVADMKTHVSDNVLALIDHGVQAFFDCDTIYVTCMDGTEWAVGLGRSMGRVNVRELVNGMTIPVVRDYDVSYLANRKPTQIRYSATFYMVAPPDIDYISCLQYINDSLYIDGLSTKMATDINFPVQLYCKDLAYYDTIELDGSQMDSILEVLDEYVTLNDTSNQLVFVADNTLPISVSINAVCLDSNLHAISAPLITTDSLLAGAPIKPYAGTASYISSGSSRSQISIPINRDVLDKLSRTRQLRLTIGANSSTQGASESNPTVVVLGKDRLNLKLYIKLAPHVRINTTIN